MASPNSKASTSSARRSSTATKARSRWTLLGCDSWGFVGRRGPVARVVRLYDRCLRQYCKWLTTKDIERRRIAGSTTTYSSGWVRMDPRRTPQSRCAHARFSLLAASVIRDCSPCRTGRLWVEWIQSDHFPALRSAAGMQTRDPKLAALVSQRTAGAWSRDVDHHLVDVHDYLAIESGSEDSWVTTET